MPANAARAGNEPDCPSLSATLYRTVPGRPVPPRSPKEPAVTKRAKPTILMPPVA